MIVAKISYESDKKHYETKEYRVDVEEREKILTVPSEIEIKRGYEVLKLEIKRETEFVNGFVGVPEVEIPTEKKEVTFERAIYDPYKGDFIERPLPRMRDWIYRHDPSAYWFAISIQNNTDKAITEWDVDLTMSAALKVIDARIEGIEREIHHEGLNIVSDIREMCASRYPKRADVKSRVEHLKRYLKMNLSERMISKDDVYEIIENGEVIEEYKDNARGYSCLICGKTKKERFIHVVCAPKDKYLAIITAYIPDPTKWGEDMKTRG